MLRYESLSLNFKHFKFAVQIRLNICQNSDLLFASSDVWRVNQVVVASVPRLVVRRRTHFQELVWHRKWIVDVVLVGMRVLARPSDAVLLVREHSFEPLDGTLSLLASLCELDIALVQLLIVGLLLIGRQVLCIFSRSLFQFFDAAFEFFICQTFSLICVLLASWWSWWSKLSWSHGSTF